MKVVVDIPDAKWRIIQDGEYCGILDPYMYDNVSPRDRVCAVFGIPYDETWVDRIDRSVLHIIDRGYPRKEVENFPPLALKIKWE